MMTLRFEDVEGLLCPVFACDVCGRPAVYGGEGDEFGCMIQWDDYKTPTWTVLHKGRCAHYWEKKHDRETPNGRGWQGWRDLGEFVTQLKNNTLHPFGEELPEQIEAAVRAERQARRSARSQAPVLTYYAQAVDGRIKIGKSINPKGRIRTLNGGVEGTGIRLVAVEFEDVERARHIEFAHLRLEGEWFQPGPELLDHIELNLEGSLRVLDAGMRAADELASS